PAHGPVSLDRLHQISEILSKAAAQSDGGNLGYAMADAVKVIDGSIAAFGAEPAPVDIEMLTTVLRNAPLAPSDRQGRPRAPVVPEECKEAPAYVKALTKEGAYIYGFNACRAAMLQAGNSPVAPDGWIPVSERMPEGMKTVITSNGFDIGQGWWDGECWKSFDCHDVVPGKVTHWMPLPAAPQQEG
ncbi:DUF551 domain-containing protein, partial [Citrobacter freundii]